MSLMLEAEDAAEHARSTVAGIADDVAAAKHMLNAKAMKW